MSRPLRHAADEPTFRPGAAAVERREVPRRYLWDTGRLFADWDAWEREFGQVERLLPDLGRLRGTLGRSGADLLRAVEAVLAVRRRLEVLYLYASLRSDEDTRDGGGTARRGRIGTLLVAFSETTSWFDPELLALPPGTAEALVEQEPGLRPYRHFLDEVQRMREHTLDQEREALLAASRNVTRGAGQIFNALNNADLRFPGIEDEEGRRVELTKARYARYLKSRDRRVRRDAFEAYLDTYGGVINTMAATLDANLKNHVYLARARRYSDTLEAALHPDAIPTEVFEALILTTERNLPTVHRYTALKQRVLGVDPLREHDLYVPLFTEQEAEHDYEEACELLLAGLAPLGDEYLEVVARAVRERWIDVHENLGKRSGAYSNSVYGHAPYILMNWSGQLRDVFTLAHEMGHAMHSHLAGARQPYVYADYPIFTAEVASTCNEMLLMDHLLRRASDPGRKLFLLDHYLGQINDTVFRQTMFASFERRIHELSEAGETLTAERLDALYLEILQRYWGPLVRFDTVRSSRTWSRIPHFYYNYYVYQYATAYAAAAVLSRRILAGEDGARERYLGFLGSGSSDYPIPTLRRAGVDMTGAEPVQAVADLFGELLDEVERTLAAGPAKEGS